MCNLSDSVEERGIQKGIQQGNAKGLAALMESLSISLDEAMKMLKIDPSEREIYKQLVEQIQAENKE
jgi:hypothetical protein